MKFITTLIRQYRAQRNKKHGAERAPRLQALLFAWCGAHLATGFGPNPYRVLWALSPSARAVGGDQLK